MRVTLVCDTCHISCLGFDGITVLAPNRFVVSISHYTTLSSLHTVI